MNFLAIIEIIKNVSSILAYFFDPSVRRRRERQAVWDEFKKLQDDYRTALADGEPDKASVIGKQMEEAREKHRFLRLS